MKPIAILYATREGQTKKICERIAVDLQKLGLQTELRNVNQVDRIDLTGYAAAILAASVHCGRHERHMVRFVKRHLSELAQLHTTFISVTLSQAGVERPSASTQERDSFAAGIARVIDNFLTQTGWQPTRIKPVAGALLYTKYNPLIRYVMKRIAKSVGAETDTSRDYEYTSWVDLDRFIEEIAGEIVSAASGRVAPDQKIA